MALLLVAGCAHAQVAPTSADDIGAARDRWAAAFNAKQLDAVMATYAKDAVFMPVTGNRVVSAMAIRVLYERLWQAMTPAITLHSRVVERIGDLAYDSGDYEETLHATDGSLALAGAYLFVFRREAGEWHLVEQSFTEKGGQPAP
jgi:ketosteroid isomerase-like protein